MSRQSGEFDQVFEDCRATADCESVITKILDHTVTMHTQPNKSAFDEDLKQDIQEYKQLLWAVKDENTMLKVKLRKLEEVLKKKQKIVDTHYLGTHNKLLFKEALLQFTHRIEALQGENDDLKEELMEKDLTICKMRRRMHTYTAYQPMAALRKKKSGVMTASNSRTSHNTARSQETDAEELTNALKSGTDDEEAVMEASPTPSKDAAAILPKAQNEDVEEQQTDDDISRAVSCSLLLDTPHDEITKLHSGFKDILSEVGKLKQSMGEMHEQQERAVGEMRLREKEFAARLYDRQQELAYASSQRLKPTTPTTGAGERPPKDGSRKAPSAFVRVSPPNKQCKRSSKPARRGGKSNNLRIRTASKNSLRDEIDVSLYIDEVLRDMDRKY